jgi:acyl-CoA synthetase (AMP-forming)/AMP-acid ligase II
MSMLRSSTKSLWERTTAAGLSAHRFFSDSDGRIALCDLEAGTTLDHNIEIFRDRAVLILAERQLSTVFAVVELDGIARRIVLCPSGLETTHLQSVLAEAEIDIVVFDGVGSIAQIADGVHVGRCGLKIAHTGASPVRDRRSEWLLFTSGTTGRPKMVVHTLDSLIGPLEDGLAATNSAVWSTFYDIRRYGGLQILMRALLGGGAIVLSDSRESPGEFLNRAGANGVTHMSGTPSHWRRALMSPSIRKISPAYVRLSGEVADQAILNSLRQAFPAAVIAHAFASTEAGVAFDVRDGLVGFPEFLINQSAAKAEMRVQDGSLRIRSSRTASRYASDRAQSLVDSEGFIDTGDMVELHNGRYYFVGRREGVINVGGMKVHPEEVEAVVNMHPDVQMSLVKARSSPITGAIVVADIVIKSSDSVEAQSFNKVKDEILATCRRILPAYKVPTLLRQVPFLDIAASGKLSRSRA